jgi:hypothetical protein
MTDDIRPHATRIDITEPAPDEIAIGSRVGSRITVCCEAGCNLEGAKVSLIAPDGSERVYPLLGCEHGAYASITHDAPRSVGEHVWQITFPGQTFDGVPHEESTASVAIRTTPHQSSLAVWNLPSSVTAGTPFTIKVGAKSSADCELRGQNVEVCDKPGAVIGSGTLGSDPWLGTAALYWTEIKLTAPLEEGICSLSARFQPAALDSEHEGASSQFQIAVVHSPEHSIRIRVFDQETGSAIEDAQIRIGPYRAISNSAGMAEMEVAKGRYAVIVWKVGHEAPVETVDVGGDLELEVAVVTLPKEDPDAAWKM